MTWNVSAAYNKATPYAQGEAVVVSITGDFTHDVEQQGQIGPGSFGVKEPNGETAMISFGQAIATWLQTVHEDVVIDPAVPIVDSSGRVWTISADGKSISTVA